MSGEIKGTATQHTAASAIGVMLRAAVVLPSIATGGAVPDRITYKSPISKDIYEKIHALRASEITLAVQAIKSLPWADTSRLVLAGTSEGGPAVARHEGNEFAGRMLFSWSCENN
jgi:hypothetical protein